MVAGNSSKGTGGTELEATLVTDAAPPPMLPSLGRERLYRALGIGVYHALETPGLCEEHAHPEVQIMITFPRAAYRATWHTAGGAQQEQQFGGAGVHVIASGQPHGFDWQAQDRLLSLYLAPAFIDRLASELGQPSRRELRAQWDLQNPLVQQIGQEVWQAFQDAAAPGQLYIESVSTLLVAHLLRQQNASLPTPRSDIGGLAPRKLRQVLDYIDAHLHRDLTLLNMAQLVNLERHHFAHAFKQSTGMAPYAFVVRCRIERAAGMLTSTNLKIHEIAGAVGFADAGQFARQFKRIVGTTPHLYRQTKRA